MFRTRFFLTRGRSKVLTKPPPDRPVDWTISPFPLKIERHHNLSIDRDLLSDALNPRWLEMSPEEVLVTAEGIRAVQAPLPGDATLQIPPQSDDCHRLSNITALQIHSTDQDRGRE
jgi:hypothetical protein